MKSFYASLVITACALHEGDAFSTFPSSSRPPSLADRPSPLYSTIVGSSDLRSNPANDAAATVKPPGVVTVHEQFKLETIREELIEKYIALGHSEEYAGREVAYFLEDSERSAQYLEMRKIAMARGNDLGIEDIVQFAGAFLVGILGSWALSSLHQIQVCYAI